MISPEGLILKPELLILDEATNGLDLFAKEKLLKQLQQINQLKTAPTNAVVHRLSRWLCWILSQCLRIFIEFH